MPAAHLDLSAAFRLPPRPDDPVGFAVASPASQHVIYRGQDGHSYKVPW